MKKSFFWGLVGTATYLIVAGAYAYLEIDHSETMKLNEFGDFLAGYFGPVALIWIVLSFTQQSKELTLQVQELRNAVEQQEAMVDLTKKQFEHNVEVVERQAEPHIDLDFEGFKGDRESGLALFRLRSSGPQAISCQMYVERGQQRMHVCHTPLLGKSLSFNFPVAMLPFDTSAIFKVTYTKSTGLTSMQCFSLVRTDIEGPLNEGYRVQIIKLARARTA